MILPLYLYYFLSVEITEWVSAMKWGSNVNMVNIGHMNNLKIESTATTNTQKHTDDDYVVFLLFLKSKVNPSTHDSPNVLSETQLPTKCSCSCSVL